MQLSRLESDQYADFLNDADVRVLDTIDYGGGLSIKIIDGGKSYGDCLGISGLGDVHVVIQTNMTDEVGTIHDIARNLQ